MTRPNPDIALIYHYDLARALNGELVDWVAIPVNVQAGREGGDLCRAAADFRTRRDLFAMPAPTVAGADRGAGRGQAAEPVLGEDSTLRPESGFDAPPCRAPVPVIPDRRCDVPGCGHAALTNPKCGYHPELAAPVGPNLTVEQQAAEPGTVNGLDGGSGSAADGSVGTIGGVPVYCPANRDRLIARIKALIDANVDGGLETLLRRYWPEGVPTLKHPGHSDAQLQLILAAVRRVEAEVGAGWHPDDGPPPHVNTNPRAEVDYPTAVVDEGGPIEDYLVTMLEVTLDDLDDDGRELCRQVAAEAHQAGRVISAHASRSVRRWSIARAVIAWAASGRTVDDMWLAASNLATFEQCRDPSATLGGLISQFTIEQADRLYEATGQPL
jgi:hypothetical protein